MTGTLQELAEQYAAGLKEYLAGAGEQALKRAYELGRAAIGGKLGVLEMAGIHRSALDAILAEAAPEHSAEIPGRAFQFLSESLSPFEMALRGFQEANLTLRRNLEELSDSKLELLRQNEKLEFANQTIEAERRRYRELFEFAPDGYLVSDMEGTIQEANSAAAALFQARQGFLSGAPLSLFLAEEEQKDFDLHLARLRQGDTAMAQDWQIRMQRQKGGTFPVAVAVAVVRDRQGRPCSLRWLLRDISERQREDEERAQLRIREQVARAEAEGVRRLEFLASASSMLAASLDYETTLTSQARLAVPFLADWCFVYVTDEDVPVRQNIVVHADPSKAALSYRLQRSLGRDSELPPSVAGALESGKSAIVHEISRVWPVTEGDDQQRLALQEGFEFKSAIVVPLIARGRTLGAMVFVVGESGRRYGATDLTLAEDLAGRSALAVDNARLYRQVVIERDRAEKASRAKDEFVAILSHELRNPLMPILGWARVFKNQPALMKDNVLSEGVKSLERNAQTVARLVEDCLDLARISARKITLERELLDLNEIADASVEAVRQRAEEKGLKLVMELAPGGLWLLGDRTRLSQAVMNLLTNAIRYTDSGGLVSVRCCRAEAEAEIEVKDTGIGVAGDFLEHIFEPFRQATNEWLTTESGLGLGLAIVKQIVQTHGGRILAESRGRGYGSTFRLRLPLTVTQEILPAAKVEAPRPTGPAAPLRILLIEDSQDILALIQMNLETLGYSVIIARDGESGLEMAEREKPDLIVSDIKIPGIDGYELIRRIRMLPALASTPAVAMTGFGMRKDIEEALAAGYNAHLTKPVEIEELCAVIRKLTQKAN